MAKDYYLILGVPLDAAPELVRSAFRKAVLRLHPDRGNEADPRAFREVSEAYDVLSDPARRARYDRERRSHTVRAAAPRADAAEDAPEPLIAETMPITGEPEALRPSVEALFDRIWRNFTGAGITKAERAEPLDFELILSREEAELGSVIPFEVPVLSVCHHCAGMGRTPSFVCESCEGEGRVIEPRSIDLRVPRGIADGAVIELSLEPLGVRNLWLRVYIRVAPH